MRVSDRIEGAAACDVINLTEAELPLYEGAGWKLARFEAATLVGFFDPMKLPASDSVQDVIEGAAAWIGAARGEIWLVMCSGTQLCDPRPISLLDASAMARLARVFAEQME